MYDTTLSGRLSSHLLTTAAATSFAGVSVVDYAGTLLTYLLVDAQIILVKAIITQKTTRHLSETFDETPMATCKDYRV